MTYLITYRGKDGKLDQIQVEAADRNAVSWIPDKPMKIEFDPKSDR